MNLTIRKLIIVALFIFYIVLGQRAFIFLFGKAWALDNTIDLATLALYVLLIGCMIAFVLPMIPVFIWPQKVWIWMIAYPFKILSFGIMVFFSVFFTGNTKDLIAAIIWSSIGICMAGNSYAGAKVALAGALKHRKSIT